MKLQHTIMITRLDNGFTIHSDGDDKALKGKFAERTEQEVIDRVIGIAKNLFKSAEEPQLGTATGNRTGPTAIEGAKGPTKKP